MLGDFARSPMKTSFLAILAVILTVSAHGEWPEETVNQLLRSVRAELPKGWSASYEKENSVLKVSRDKAVSLIYYFINHPPGQKPERRKFFFAFSVLPALTPSEYRRLSAENVKIQKEAAELYEDLKKRGLSHKFDSFGGETDEDKAAVARYDALKMSRHSLPDYYFRDIGLRLAVGLSVSKFSEIYITDERIRGECTKVQNSIVKLLSKY